MPRAKTKPRATPPSLPHLTRYFEASRDFATGFIFIVPLLVGYELGVLALRSDTINWVNGLVRLVLHGFGPAEPVVFLALVAALCVKAIRKVEGLRIDAELYGLMLAESLVYACALGLLGSFTVRRLLQIGAAGGTWLLARDIVLSIGAGVYEEALFRVGLLGAMHHALKHWATVRPGVAAFLSITASSLVFAACHHLGPYGDPLDAALVLFRFMMGIAFATIYIYRGLGIVVYTHALYDVFVSLAR
jgi:membrane protease YdiL (CAAX protease family)